MAFDAIKQTVKYQGAPPDAFLRELVAWGETAAGDIFAENPNPSDVYASVAHALGPWQGDDHRRAVMLEVLRVLAGFESSWNWNAGSDPDTAAPDRQETLEAGAWQVSANSMNLGQGLKELVLATIGTSDIDAFQAAMKQNHPLAMEYISRLLRITVEANGPVARHEIDPWLRRDAVAEFQAMFGN